MLKSKKKRSPADIVKHTRDTLSTLEKSYERNEKAASKAVDELSKHTSKMKNILYGNAEHAPNKELAAQLQQEIFNSGLISRFITDLPMLEFEARKDVATIINNLLHKSTSTGRNPTAEHIAEHPEVLDLLVKGYENPDIALVSGTILRECLKHEALAKSVLFSQNFFNFFSYVEVANFDIASDAFATFKDLLSLHKAVSAEFLANNYDQVFASYTSLLNSSNYVTRRLSLKLLGELLLDRSHFAIMTKYISEVKNLKLIMNLLRDKSKNIQYEAFHVFKVFVANPNKPAPILDILVKNKSRLIPFLQDFQKEKEEEDEQFKDEKAFLLRQIEQL